LSSAITIYAQGKGGAMQDLSAVPMTFRIENALVAYVKYLGKTLWPVDLAVLYPLSSSLPFWQYAGSLLILLLATAAVLRAGRRYPYLATGWFWFLVTLVPVIGLMQVGVQSMADRYTYIPLVGLFIVVAWGAGDLTKGLKRRREILCLLGGAWVTASMVLTFHQLAYWRDSISLYRHTLEVTGENYIIRYHLGEALASSGDADAGIQEYRESIRINPNDAFAHYDLGIALAGKGSLDDAIRQFRQALLIHPDDPKAHTNLGVALARKGDLDAAIHEFQETLRIDPEDAKAQGNLEIALSQRR
jgi:tetratricopeptide (TPR) repeat protein